MSNGYYYNSVQVSHKFSAEKQSGEGRKRHEERDRLSPRARSRVSSRRPGLEPTLEERVTVLPLS